jgi:hypothetical protein
VSNTITAFLETLVAESGDYNAATVSNLSFLDGVYLDIKPEVARAGKTIQVYFPDVGAFTDQAANDWTPEDINPSYVSLVFNQRPGKGILVRDFEQWQTGVDIRTKFLDPMFKRGLEYFNAQVAGLITNANFNSNSVLVGGTNGEVTVTDAANAWDSLATAKVPLSDPTDLSIFTHNTVHKAMLLDTSWSQESLVGAMIAQDARQKADLGQAFNFRKRWDQQAPKKRGTALTGTVSAAGSTTAVTGSGTSFTTQVEVGDRITLAGDATVYVVASVTDNTHLAMTANVTSASGVVATQQGYTCLAAHRYAMALAVRPLELVNDGTTQSRIVMLNGIPFRVMISYQHKNSGYLVTVDCGCAVGVIRPAFGVLIKV